MVRDKPLLSGSLLMIFGSFFTSSVNYLYHLVMGRALEPANYGVLASIISLVGLLSLIPTSIGLVVTKIVAGASDNNEINQRVYGLNRSTWLMSLIFFCALLVVSPIISNFLKVDEFLLVIGLLVFLFSFPSSLTRAVLQGMLRFKSMVISQTSENLLRLAVGVVLVVFGFSVGGALLGLFVGVAFGWFIAWMFIRNFFKRPKELEKQINFKSILLSSLPFLVLSVSMTSFYSTDLILVKHFFSSFDAGIYSAMSFLGRIIFFGVSPITAVMFPIVARSHARGESAIHVLKWSLLGGLIIAVATNTVFGLFPNFVIEQLYGDKYLAASNLLLLFGVFVAFATLSFLLLNYELVINRIWPVWVSLFAAIIQIFFIWFFHQTLFQVVFVSILIAFLLLIYLLADTLFSSRKLPS